MGGGGERERVCVYVLSEFLRHIVLDKFVVILI